MSCILIFISKTIENILSTLKIIYISNHKKLLGSILNFVITLIWILSAIYILRNFNKNPLCIFIYSLGCFIGTYLGCIIEEKLALGNNMLTVLTAKYIEVEKALKNLEYNVITIDGYNMDNIEKVLIIIIPRRKKYKVHNIIKLIDKNATIIYENISYYDK